MIYTLRMDACMHRFGFYKPFWLVDIGELPLHLDSPLLSHEDGFHNLPALHCTILLQMAGMRLLQGSWCSYVLFVCSQHCNLHSPVGCFPSLDAAPVW